jgi:hypothetical protein
VCDRPAFSLAQALPSRPSAGDFSPLFGPFAGTPAWSDSSATYAWVVRLAPSPTGLLLRAERRGGLPVLARGVSWRARVPATAPGSLAARVSAANDVAFPFCPQGRRPEFGISRLDGRPASASVHASPAMSPPPAQDPRSAWFATPLLLCCGALASPTSLPVYPGAFGQPTPFDPSTDRMTPCR